MLWQTTDTPLREPNPVIRLFEGNFLGRLSDLAQESRISRRLAWPRSFLADFRTLYECLERVARDDGLIVNFRSITMQWPGEKDSEVLWYERSFPSQERRILGHLVPRTLSDSHGHTKIFFNIETGELMGPDGIAFKDLQIRMVRLSLTLMRPDTKELYRVILAREFPDRRIKTSIDSEDLDRRAVLRDLLASLESKLKLAAKLREARKRRRQDAQPEKRK